MATHPTPRHLSFALFLLLCAMLVSGARAQGTLTRLASSGDLLGDGTPLLSFDLPVLNDSGRALVHARLDANSDGVADGAVLLIVDFDGTLHEIARTGDPLGDGNTIDSFSTNGGLQNAPFLTVSGVAAFQITSLGLGGKAILTGNELGYSVYVSDGDPVLGSTTGEVISNLSLLAYSDAGGYVYSLQPKGQYSTRPTEFWRNLDRVVYPGQTYGTSTISQLTTAIINPSGDLAVSATVWPPSPAPSYVAWLRPLGPNLLVVLDETMSAPTGGTFELGASAGARFFNRQVQAGFVSLLNGVPYNEDVGAYLGTGGNYAEFLREGGPAIGGGNYTSIKPWDFDDNNVMLVRADRELSGDRNWYGLLFRMDAGGVKSPVFNEGDIDPLGDGSYYSFQEGLMNEAGAIAFLAKIYVGGTLVHGLQLFDGSQVATVAREGQTLDGQVLTRIDFAGRVGTYCHRRAMNSLGSVVFLAEGGVRNAIYRYDPSSVVAAPSATAMLVDIESVRPNPFNPRTTIRFQVGAAQRVRVGIYDLAGRLLRNLDDRVRAAGSHRLNWNGMDDRGRKVASGVYLVRVSGEQSSSMAKISLIK